MASRGTARDPASAGGVAWQAHRLGVTSAGAVAAVRWARGSDVVGG